MNCEHSDVIFLRRLSNKVGQLLMNVFYQITSGMKGAVKQLAKAVVAEEFVGGRARVGDTVRKSEKSVARIEHRMPGQVNCFGQRSDYRARWFQLLSDSLRSYYQGRIVAGIDIA